jgi:cyanophycinase
VTSMHGHGSADSAGSAAQRMGVRAQQTGMGAGRKAARGTLIAIGGSEQRDPDANMPILAEIARATRGRRLVLIAAASTEPHELVKTYRTAFQALGLRKVDSVDIKSHQEAYDPAHVQLLKSAGMVFFTGGDQNRITSLIGGSPFLSAIERFYEGGGIVAGSSAGAAALPVVMLSGGPADGPAPAGDIALGPGLGLFPGAIIDTHFGQRGRMDRLLKAVARQPGLLGVGIDEDTAIVITGTRFRTIGAGSVRVLDGTGITYSSLSDRGDAGILAIHNLLLHALGPGDRFDLHLRRPLPSVEDA